MGKYIRKAKATPDLPVLRADSPGVRTRSASAASAESGNCGVGSSYLQLRSRLLIRRPQGRVAARDAVAKRRRRSSRAKQVEEAEGGDGPCGGEASCGDNGLELEGRERSARETSPCCSLTNDPDGARTPGSSTKPSSLTQTNRRLRGADCRNIPSTQEMDDFFAGAEEEQQKTFINKYNFDPVNEKPLPGRFKWEKVDP